MRALQTSIEQFRQAMRIHGGFFSMCLVALLVKLARLPIPSQRMRLWLYRTIFGKKYAALDETETERPIADYSSFNALFTRGVRPELRPIATAADQFVCPCDGRVQDVGSIERDRILTAKGIEYTTASLLAGTDAEAFNGGQYAIIFLSPTDCHRIFSPQDGYLEQITHVPGYRLLVHPPYQRKEYPVFALNERVILRLSTPLGPCAVVMVAGWGVGHITFPQDPGFRPRRRKLSHKVYQPPLPLRRGDWIATFELGSTAILLTAPAEHSTPLVSRDEKLKYGQPLVSVGAAVLTT